MRMRGFKLTGQSTERCGVRLDGVQLSEEANIGSPCLWDPEASQASSEALNVLREWRNDSRGGRQCAKDGTDGIDGVQGNSALRTRGIDKLPSKCSGTGAHVAKHW